MAPTSAFQSACQTYRQKRLEGHSIWKALNEAWFEFNEWLFCG